MDKEWHRYTIYGPESFELRRPVLEAMSALRGRWRVVDGNTLELDLLLDKYSKHERDVIEFAINPLQIGENIFGGLDRPVQKALATAINEIFGPDSTVRV
jgi:hypothetical protein